MAVGRSQNVAGSVVGSEVWTLRHGTWSRFGLASGNSPTNQKSLDSVSCPQLGSCVTVAGPGEGYALRLSAGVWRPTPRPTAPLSSVSCVSLSSCVALLPPSLQSSRNQAPYALVWNGSTWGQLALVPGPGQFTFRLAAVSCVGTSFCMAVGSSEQMPIAEAWNGSHWTITTPQETTSGSEELDAVSCTSSSQCFAVGTKAFDAGVNEGFGMNWNGTTWTQPKVFSEGSFSGVACPSPTTCLAVGSIAPANGIGPHRAVIKLWDGSAWTSLQGAAVGVASTLYAVSCSRVDWCAAVGSTATLAGITQPPIERWSGTSLKRM